MEGPISFAIYTLSRGKGVPPEAGQALRRAEALIEADRERGIALSSSTSRLGIEGESRLCVEYEDAEAGRAVLQEIEEIVAGVDLIRVEPGPCKERPHPPLPGSAKEEG